MTPIFFGSALKNFGVGDLLNALGELAPPPRTQAADKRVVSATEPGMSAFVFKIQANMDPNHRDRIAFVRLCSGKLTRGMKVNLSDFILFSFLRVRMTDAVKTPLHMTRVSS